MARKRGSKPGAQGSPVSETSQGRIIEGKATEVTDDMSNTAPDFEDAQVTESAPLEEIGTPTNVEVPEPPSTRIPEAAFAGVILSNGSEVDPLSAVKCGKCGAQFYAKDALDGCPAADSAGVCGGTVGPVQV